MRQNQLFHDQLLESEEHHEKEKATLRKRIDEYEKRMNTMSEAYEDKIKQLKGDLKDLKKEGKGQKEDNEANKKRVEKLEKAKEKSDRDRIIIEENLK